MKVFVTQCRVGDLTADGEGNGKKISKKRAAERMLEELAKLPAIPNMTNNTHLKRKRVATKKKTRNLIKVTMDKTSDYVEDINPISRLIQIQQANKEKEPVYTVSNKCIINIISILIQLWKMFHFISCVYICNNTTSSFEDILIWFLNYTGCLSYNLWKIKSGFLSWF